MVSRKNAIGLALLVASCLLSLACASEPAGPAKGTPAFYWAAAKETFTAGDYAKTSHHLDQILKGANQFTALAQPWKLVLTSGLASGFLELADGFDAGSRVNKQNPTYFRKQMMQNQSLAREQTLTFVEAWDRFLKSSKDAEIKLAFPYPQGSPLPVGLLAKVGSGILPDPREVDSALPAVLQRAVLLNTCRAAGAPDDTAKTQQLLASGDGKVPRAAFVLAMANSLAEQAQLFGPSKRSEPDVKKTLESRALEALKTIPETKESKGLAAKIEKSQKLGSARR